jgi:hypothetical protein
MSEPTPADVAAVANTLGEQPTQPTPTHQAAPQTPTPEPTPVTPPVTPQTPTDPFAQFTQPTPPTQQTQPVEPQAQVQAPQQPTEPATTPQPEKLPVEPAQPVQEEPTYQSYEDYMNSVLKDVPKSPELPDSTKISPDDPDAIKNFFDELVNTAVTKAEHANSKKQAIQATERRLWDESFDKYGTLKTNKNLRDMVHSIRMGYFQRGIAITPVQAADKLLDSLGSQYKQGVADSAVVTTIQDVQPNGGQSGTPVTTTLDKDSVLQSVQTGGEQALAEFFDQQIKSGKM